jgi:hypothetical protein
MDGIAKARASCGAGSEHADRRIYGWRSQELPSAEQDEMAAIAAVTVAVTRRLKPALYKPLTRTLKRALYELPNLERRTPNRT